LAHHRHDRAPLIRDRLHVQWTNAKSEETAREFVAYLQSPEARAAFKAKGFDVQ